MCLCFVGFDGVDYGGGVLDGDWDEYVKVCGGLDCLGFVGYWCGGDCDF